MGVSRRGDVERRHREPSADLSIWPPAGAVAIDLAGGYERLAEHGYGYGPAFRGLTALWSRGEELFAEVSLPEAAGGTAGFGMHPALLDAALHAAVLANRTRRSCCRSFGRVCPCTPRARRRCGRGSRR